MELGFITFIYTYAMNHQFQAQQALIDWDGCEFTGDCRHINSQFRVLEEDVLKIYVYMTKSQR